MNLICSCCAGEAPSKRQWWNRDTGYGICPRCFKQETEHPSGGWSHACFSYGIPGIHHSLDEKPQLFFAVLALRIKYASHETDLYIPVSETTRKLLEDFPLNNKNKTVFTNQVEGGLWFDIPFAYLPEWARKTGKPMKI